MRRFLVTLSIVVTLAVTYRVYSAVLLPLTEIRKTARPLVDPLESDIRRPAVFEEQALQVFPEAEWTHRAQQTWQMAESAYLYFNEQLRVPGSGNTIQISPVAIFWQDPKRPQARPFRVLAERAQIKFQNSFFDTAIAMSNANPGRIVWASLEGNVHIDGPDGLMIDGQNFKFEEESFQLYSDHSIKFAYGPSPVDHRKISGTADQLQLTFEPSHESILGKDMPRVGGLAQLLLRRNVALEMSFEQQGVLRNALIRSAGSFLYDVAKREAILDDQVHVEQVSQTPQRPLKDSIDCAWLQLQFDQQVPATPEPSRGRSNPFDGLVFRSMRAQGSESGRGSRLKVVSDEQKLAAVMQDLTYDAQKRRAVMIDQERVVIHRENIKFACPQIGLQHSATNQLEYLECRGAGQMDVAAASPQEAPMMARWAKRVQVGPDQESGVHRVRIEEQALLGIPGQFGIAADLLHLWVNLEQVPATPGSRSSERTPGSANLLAGPLPLKRARAEGNVRLDSRLLKVEQSQMIDVVIHPGVLTAPLSKTPTAGEHNRSESVDRPWIVSADSLNVDLIHDSLQAVIDVRQVTGNGKVLIQHDPGPLGGPESSALQGPLVLKGHHLVATNEGETRQMLTLRALTGPQGEIVENASISLGTAVLWGGHLTLVRHENRVDVPGPGGLSAPIPAKAGGTGASAATKLDIVWQEGMSFDGLSARFWGKVTTAVPGEQQSITRLLCEDLNAILNQQISFTNPQDHPQDLAISQVEARHHVVVENFEYQKNQLAAVRRSELAGFQIDMNTGAFQGDGPGTIHAWSLGDPVKFSPGEGPQANQPVRPSDARWRYTKVQFAGRMDGNMQRNDATLRERVEVITAPVEKALTKFQREQLSESTPEAENAVWMKCPQMRILQKPGAGPNEKFYEVFATGGTELEGHVFRAVADELTFDERRGQFTLRGLGKEARLYYQAQPGQNVSPSAARLIEFVPVKRKITIDGSSGISGSY